MMRQFPNLLDENKVIQLANSVVPDASITYKSNQFGGQHSGEQQQVQHHQQHQQQHFQQGGYIPQQYWGNQFQPQMSPHHHLCPCCWRMRCRY